MKQTVLVANLMLAAAFLATAQKTPESMLGAALHQEEVQGDLKGAIAAYQKVVAAPGVSRKTAAEALVRMGQCYEKLGDAESRKAYERVLRDYADQKEAAALARSRLAGNSSASSAGVVTRRVWTKSATEGSVSPDGRYLSFVDWETGDLALHDLSTGNDRRLTGDAGPHGVDESVFSPDGKQVAYAWTNKNGAHELRVIRSDANGPANPRTLYATDEGYIGPFDWSPDGKWIAVERNLKDRTKQMGLVSAASGSLRVLKSSDWRGANRMFFSPDSQYLAFDLPSGEGSGESDILVLAIDGSREIPAVVNPANDYPVGWTPDGKHLLFASDRSGSTGIWALPFEGGNPQGPPRLIKSDIGPVEPLGATRSGKLYFEVQTGGRDVYTAAVDFTSGRILTPPVPAIQEFIGFNLDAD